jgi:hypothetical protein
MADYLFTISEDYNLSPPNIPLPAEINLERLAKSLRKTDPSELVFDTRPIGKPITSRNNRTYSAASVKRLVEQVNEKRPEGRWGHVDGDGSPPPFRWLAAVYDETTQTGWAKYVALTEEAERYIMSSEELKARVGTSIYARNAKLGKDDVIEDYDLIRIDFASAEVLGIPSMATVPNVTKEELEDLEENNMGINTTTTTSVTPVTPVTLVTPVTEVSADVAQKERLIESYERDIAELKQHDNILNAVCEQFGVKRENILETVKSYRSANAALTTENKKLLEGYITSAVAEAVVSEDVRDIVTEMVNQRSPATRAEVDAAVAAVTAQESVKKLLKAAVLAETGGVMTNNNQPNNTNTYTSMFE